MMRGGDADTDTLPQGAESFKPEMWIITRKFAIDALRSVCYTRDVSVCAGGPSQALYVVLIRLARGCCCQPLALKGGASIDR